MSEMERRLENLKEHMESMGFDEKEIHNASIAFKIGWKQGETNEKTERLLREWDEEKQENEVLEFEKKSCESYS